MIIAPTGKVIERYHKIQLAERWPQAGDHLSAFKMDGVPCSVIICHDERYPELVRLPVLAGAKVVFYLSHESGMRSERKVNPYRAQIQARAVENTGFVVQANAPANEDASGSHGQSRIIGPDGNILQVASIFQEEVLTETLDLRQARLAATPRKVWTAARCAIGGKTACSACASSSSCQSNQARVPKDPSWFPLDRMEAMAEQGTFPGGVHSWLSDIGEALVALGSAGCVISTHFARNSRAVFTQEGFVPLKLWAFRGFLELASGLRVNQPNSEPNYETNT